MITGCCDVYYVIDIYASMSLLINVGSLIHNQSYFNVMRDTIGKGIPSPVLLNTYISQILADPIHSMSILQIGDNQHDPSPMLTSFLYYLGPWYPQDLQSLTNTCTK